MEQERQLPLKFYNLMHNRGAHNRCFANSAIAAISAWNCVEVH